jgi:peptidoglycan hydrolase-like protein with peptidoglycan-binding domain
LLRSNHEYLPFSEEGQHTLSALFNHQDMTLQSGSIDNMVNTMTQTHPDTATSPVSVSARQQGWVSRFLHQLFSMKLPATLALPMVAMTAIAGVLLSAGEAAAQVLSRGDSGDAVLDLQNALNDAGYFFGPYTGFYGEITEDAVIELQLARDLQVDGDAGPETLSSLGLLGTLAPPPVDRTDFFAPANPTLSFGDAGPLVTTLQEILIDNGYLAPGLNTGYYGSLTVAAVEDMQADSGYLDIDGAFGPNTREYVANGFIGVAPANPQAALPSIGLSVLDIGSSGPAVVQLQEFLISAGYLAEGLATGFYGPLTQTAVEDMQADSGYLSVDGRFGPNTLAYADTFAGRATLSDGTIFRPRPSFLTRTLRFGDSGDDVQQVQQILIALGFLDPGLDTGYFGTMTEQAVIDLQTASPDLTIDGTVGPETGRALSNTTV